MDDDDDEILYDTFTKHKANDDDVEMVNTNYLTP
jgi:hypothetical protein